MSNPSPTSEAWVIRLLRLLARAVYRHPRLFIIPQVVLMVISLAYTITHLEFDTSRDNLVGAEKKHHQNFLKFKKEFTQQDDLVVMVESEDMERNRQFTERLGPRLEAETNMFVDVFFRGDLKMLGRKAFLFIEESDLTDLRDKLKEYRPVIEKFSSLDNLVGLFRFINRQFATAKAEANADNEALVRLVPMLDRVLSGALDAIRRPGVPPSPGVEAFFGDPKEAQKRTYITFNDGRIFLINVHAVSEDKNMAAVERLRELVAETQLEVPGVNVGVTGGPVLEHDEMEQSKRDTALASVVALIIVALIFIYGYQETGRPIKATLCLIIGLIYTLGFSTLVVGHLNLLTITFLPMLIGLAIDFGVHLISRYEEELHNGRTEEQALQTAVIYTGLGVVTGALTTAGAFLAMGITDFKGIKEMGIISGGGLLICLVPMMTVLPALLVRGRQNALDHKLKIIDHRARLEQFWLDRPKWVIAITIGLSVLALSQVGKVSFDYNLLNMQTKGLPAVMVEKKLMDSATNSVLFAAVVADSLEQANALERKLTNLTTVANVHSMSTYLGEPPGKRLALIGDVKKELESIHFAPEDPKLVDVKGLNWALWTFNSYIDLALVEIRKSNSEPELEKQFLAIKQRIAELREILAYGNEADTQARLTVYQRAFFGEIRATFDALRQQDNSGPMLPQDLPPAFRNRFVGVTGKYLLQVFPKEDVWERKPQEEFVRQLRTLDENVTGDPIQLYEYVTLLKSSYEQAAYYALIAIILLVLFHFRSLMCVVLALLPVGIGALWMVGIMGTFGVPFNPANIMTLPLVIGIGVTSGIQILNRYAEEQTPSIFSKSTGLAVVVSALNTVAGFGSLILAKHQGIQTLGFVMSAGTMTCMLVAVTFLPAMLTLLQRAGWRIKPIKNPAP